MYPSLGTMNWKWTMDKLRATRGYESFILGNVVKTCNEELGKMERRN